MTKRPAQRGVTLVELLVTIILAAIFFAAAVPLFVFAQKQSSGDRVRVTAANVAQAELENARSMKYKDLPAGVPAGVPVKYYKTVGGRVFTVERTITNVPSTATDTATGSEALYKLVKVEVYWTAPPEPVKHVVFKTAIYPQYKGPEVTDLTVTNVIPEVLTTTQRADGSLLGLIQPDDFPLTMSATVNPLDLSRTAFVHFTITAKTGGFATYKDVQAVNGMFTWEGWDDAQAGDGEYAFSAVAVSTAGKMGDYRTLNFEIQGRPAKATLAAAGVRAGNGAVLVQWSAPAAGDLGSYELEIFNGSTTDVVQGLSTRSTAYIYRGPNDEGLPVGEYSFTVVAVDADGNRGSSDEQSANVTTSTPAPGPLTPAGFIASLLDSSGLGIVTQNATLTWDANTDATAMYFLYRNFLYPSDPDKLSLIAVVDIADGATSYTSLDPQIGWGVTVTYSLSAVDADLNESSLATASVTTPPPPPAEKFGLTIKVSGYDAFVTVASLVNGDVYDINGNRIVPDPSFSSIFVGSNQKQGVTFKNLPYSTYHVTVTAVDGKRVPIPGVSKDFDVELVRNEIVSITL